MIVCYTLYKVYGKIRYFECRKCYREEDDLNVKGYCKSCHRDSNISKITDSFSYDFYINPNILIVLYWVLIGISILLIAIRLTFSIKSLLIYSSISLLLATITYLIYTIKQLKIKK